MKEEEKKEREREIEMEKEKSKNYIIAGKTREEERRKGWTPIGHFSP